MSIITLSKPELAILSRIDINVDGKREQRSGVITIHSGKSFRQGYRFDCFQIETIEGDIIFISTETIKVMAELIDELRIGEGG